MPTGLGLILRLAAVAAVLVATYLAGFTRAESHWKLELAKQTAALQAATIAQEAKVNDAEHRMAEAAASRAAIEDQLQASTASVAGLAARLRAAEARGSRAVPAAGSDSGPATAVPQSACDSGRIDAAVQSVFDAARHDGIELAKLASRPLCECSN